MVLLLGKDGRRVMELRALSNEDLFERWRRDLGFRYRTERPRKEALRFVGLYEKFLGGYPPSADLAKQSVSVPGPKAEYASWVLLTDRHVHEVVW